MAIEMLSKSTLEPAFSRSRSTNTSAPEPVSVGVHLNEGKLTFSGGTQGNAVIVADPPMLILTADTAETRVFRVGFRVETPGYEFPPDGAIRFQVGNHDAGLQILRDTPTEATVLFFNGLKGKEKDLGSFDIGLQPSITDESFAAAPLPQPMTVWHDPSILWEPPKG